MNLATASQAAEIVELNKQFHLDIPDFRWDTLEWVVEQIALGNYFVATDANGVTAALCVVTDHEEEEEEEEEEDKSVIEAMAVRPDQQKTGLGRLLIAEALSISTARGLKVLVVESFCVYGVEGFYEKCGFTRAEKLEQFSGLDHYCFSIKC